MRLIFARQDFMLQETSMAPYHRNSLHERDTGDLVLLHANHVGRSFGSSFEKGFNSFDALLGWLHENALSLLKSSYAN